MSGPFLHRLAISAVCVALVTLTFGALVTTKNAGMAFTDWPTSDGYLMVTYPWLSDFAKNWDKFLEHGHRLAGMLIGMWSIALVVAAWRCDSRRSVRWLSVAVLLGVICQGLLGGFRVQLDDRGLAMLHGIFAAIVFSIMGAMVVITGKGWRDAADSPPVASLFWLKLLAIAIFGTLSLQYVLGSLIRHQGLALHEHLGLGILVALLASVNGVAAAMSGIPWLQRSAFLLMGVIIGQAFLGGGAWIAKYGLASAGYVAVADSIQQVLLRTAHMVFGTCVYMAGVVHVLKVFRVDATAPRRPAPVFEVRRKASSTATPGGAG